MQIPFGGAFLQFTVSLGEIRVSRPAVALPRLPDSPRRAGAHNLRLDPGAGIVTIRPPQRSMIEDSHHSLVRASA